jgi:hypothetical protein
LILEEPLPEAEADLKPHQCPPAHVSEAVLGVEAQSPALECGPQLPEKTKPTVCSGFGRTEEGSLQTKTLVAEPSMLGSGIPEEKGQSGRCWSGWDCGILERQWHAVFCDPCLSAWIKLLLGWGLGTGVLWASLTRSSQAGTGY